MDDIGIVLGARRHGETRRRRRADDARAWAPSRLVRGGFGSRHQPVLQAGNLGERHVAGAVTSISAITRSKDSICGRRRISRPRTRSMASIISLRYCRLLPERDPHRPVFDLLDLTIAELAEPAAAAALVARFRIAACSPSSASASILRPAPPPARPAIWSMCRPRAVGRCRAGPASRGGSSFLALPASFAKPASVAPSAAFAPGGLRPQRLLPRRHVFEPRGERCRRHASNSSPRWRGPLLRA